MSIFGAITTFAASSLTTAFLESHKLQNAPAHDQQQQQQQTNNNNNTSHNTHHRRSKQQSILPQRVIIQAPIMQPTGLPHNSIWTTMSYPIPRGPCLQKSSLISACSCQRFMVHPLKATTSFDCDGCGHHASFHKMKSHEEEVENAARFRETLLNVEAAVGGGGSGGGENNELRGSTSGRGRAVGLLQGRIETEEDEEEEDDETVDGDGEFLEPERKRRVVAAGKKAVVPRAVSARGGKRKRVGEQVVIE